MSRRFSPVSRSGSAALLLLIAPLALSAASEFQPSATPEVDFGIEVVAVSLGGREVLAHVVEDGLIVRTDGKRATTMPENSPSRSKREFDACSRDASGADERSECESYARLDLPRAMPGDVSQTNRAKAIQANRFSFERIADNGGIASVLVNDNLLRIPIETDDDLLTRVRLLTVTDSNNLVLLAESLKQYGEALRWRSLVLTIDGRGRVRNTLQLDGRDGNLTGGDYVVANERGEIGVLKAIPGGITVDWRSPSEERSSAAGSAGIGRSDSPDVAGRSATEIPAVPFDFAAFAKESARLDGDPGRSSERPISRAEVLENITGFLNAQWQLSQGNYLHPGIENACEPAAKKFWRRPSRLDDSLGHKVAALPYKWGGYVSVETFLARIDKQQLAGSVCTCRDPGRNYCIVENATGVDCSGFVSRVWGIDRNTTVSLSNITKSVSWKDLKPGDVLNKPGSHVRVFLETSRGAEIGVRIAESSVSCGGVCEKVVNARDLDGYQPRRFIHILE